MTIRKTTRLLLTFAVVMVMTILAAVPAMAGTSQYWGNTTINKHTGGNENITIGEVDENDDVLWENVAYCFNLNKGTPSYTGDETINTYENLGEQSDATWKSHSANKNFDGNMKDVLTKVVYMGFPYDGSNEIRTILKEQCKVSDEYLDDAFRAATQKAVWHVTDGRAFKVPSEGRVPTGNTTAQVSEYIAKIIYEKAVAFTGDTGLNLRLWASSGVKQNLLDTMRTSTPEEPQNPEPQEPQNPEPQNPEPQEPQNPEPQEPQNLEPQEPQNLEPQEPQNLEPQNPDPQEPQNPETPETPEKPEPRTPDAVGIGISKVNIAGNEIAGAHIVIRNSDGVTVEEWVSKKGKTHYTALEPGTYTFHEEAAPDGYKAVTDIKFSVDSEGKITVVSANGNTVKVDKVTGNLVVTDEYLENIHTQKSGSDGAKTERNTNIVETGDNANMILYIMLMVGSLMGLGGMLVLKKD